jgi:very-short-patch-repair endonuclease
MKTTEQFIAEARLFHPEYDYSKVNYVGATTKVIIGCPKHGYVPVHPRTILNIGEGCPICSESKGEKVIRNWLEKYKINYNRQQRFADLGRYSYDFYIPNLNLLIEYNGEQHYKEKPYFHRKPDSFECQLKRDELKKDYAEKNGYKLLVIPYTDFNNIESILEKNILSSQK